MKNYLAYCLISLVVASSCSTTNPRYVSAPSVPNTTFFRQKGDMKFSISAAAAPGVIEKYNYTADNNDDTYKRKKSTVYGFDGQAAFAITHHFMVGIEGMYRNELDKFTRDDLNPLNDRSEIGYERKMINGSVGFFAPLGNSLKTYFNFLGGIGIGKVHSKDNGFLADAATTKRYYDADLFKINLHPSFNFFFSDYFRMSVAPRFSFLKFNNIQTNYTIADLETTQYKAVQEHYLPLFEPSVMLQAGFPGADWMKLDMGFHFSSNPDIGAYNLNSRKFLLSLGFSIYPFDSKRK